MTSFCSNLSYTLLCALHLLHLHTIHFPVCSLGAYTLNLNFCYSMVPHSHSPDLRVSFLPQAGTVPEAEVNQLASQGCSCQIPLLHEVVPRAAAALDFCLCAGSGRRQDMLCDSP